MSHKKIFIVDDDIVLSTMLVDHLSVNPMYEVESFETGEECLDNIHRNPDVVILDYRLNSINPEAADGLEILQKIKNYAEDIRVIMLSSQTQYGKAVQTIMKGATEYVLKDKNSFQSIDRILSNME